MNYIAEINAFERWLETNPLHPSSQLLWYKLVSIFNRCGWKEWISVDNHRLMLLIGIRREETFINIRSYLVKSGLIEYKKGKKGSPGEYKLISFENTYQNGVHFGVKSGVESEVKSGVKSEVKSGVKSGVQNRVESGVQNRVESGVQNRNINKQNINKTKQNKIEKESKEKEYSITAVEDTSKIVSSNNLSHIVPYAEIVELYNSICVSLNPVVKLTDKRKQSIGARYREYGYDIEIFKTLFEKVQASPFLVGNNQKGWQADFDWLMKPNNFVKVMEDKYKPKPQEKEQREKDKEEEEIKSGKYGIHL